MKNTTFDKLNVCTRLICIAALCILCSCKTLSAQRVEYSWSGTVERTFNSGTSDPWGVGSAQPFSINAVFDRDSTGSGSFNDRFYSALDLNFFIDGVSADSTTFQSFRIRDDAGSNPIDYFSIGFDATFQGMSDSVFSTIILPASTYSFSDPPKVPTFGTQAPSGATSINSSGNYLFKTGTDASHSSQVRATEKRQKIFLDWDAAIPQDYYVRSVSPLLTGDFGTEVVDINKNRDEDVVSASDSYKNEVRSELERLFVNSGVSEFIQIVNTKDSETLVAKFGNSLEFDDDGDSSTADSRYLGEAYDTGSPSRLFDRFNQRKSGSVAAFIDPNVDSAELVAEVLAHELGHGMGLRHIDPSVAGGIGVPIMDYDWVEGDAGATLFTNDSTAQIFDRVDEGTTHNPLYHLRRFTLGESEESLIAQGILPGVWDDEDFRFDLSKLDYSAMSSAISLFDISVQIRLGDEDWLTIASYESLDDMTDSLYLNSAADFRIIGATEADGLVDAFFGIGDVSDPDWNLNGAEFGSIFYVDNSGEIAKGGDFEFNFTSVPEPNSLALLVCVSAFLFKRRYRLA